MTGTELFEQERAFREAHEACEADLKHAVSLSAGVDEASVTVTCGCGESATMRCAPDVAQAFGVNCVPTAFC